MRYLFTLLSFFISASISAQPPVEKKQAFQMDTVALQPTLERTMIQNVDKINQLKASIAELEKSNRQWYKVIIETGKIDTLRIEGQPQYVPGKMIFKIKPK